MPIHAASHYPCRSLLAVPAGLEILGYRHAIATMWTIADSPAPGVADSVYAMLARHGTLDPERAAEPLRRPTRTPGPYIHFGD